MDTMASQDQQQRIRQLEDENELMLLQLHQVQEELEHYFLLNQENVRKVAALSGQEVPTVPARSSKPRLITRITDRLGITIQDKIDLVRSSGLFDEAWYLAQYPDVAGKGMDPVEHYLRHGASEGRNPGPQFDTNWYLQNFRDVAKAGMNPLLHYVRFGRHEGRLPRSGGLQPAPDPFAEERNWLLNARDEQAALAAERQIQVDELGRVKAGLEQELAAQAEERERLAGLAAVRGGQIETQAREMQVSLTRQTELEGRVSALVAERDALSGQVLELRSTQEREIRALADRCAALEKELVDTHRTQAEVLAQEHDAQALKAVEHVQVIRQAGAHLAALEEENHVLASRLSALESLHQALQASRDEQVAEMAEQLHLLARLEGENQTLLEQRIALTSERDSLAGLRHEQQIRLGQLTQERDHFSLKVDELAQQIEIVHDEAATLSAARDALVQESASRSERIVQLEQSLSVLAAEQSNLTQRQEAGQQRIAQLEVEKEWLVHENGNLTDQLVARQMQFDDLDRRWRELDQFSSFLATERDSLMLQLQASRERIGQLEQQHLALADENSGLGDRVAASEEQLDALAQTRNKLEQALTALAAERDNLMLQLQASRERIGQLEQQHLAMVGENSGLGDRVAALEEQRDALAQTRNELEQALIAQAAEREALVPQLAASRERIGQLEGQHEVLVRDNGSLADLVEARQQQIETLARERNELAQASAALVQEREQLSGQLAKRQELIAGLEREKADLDKELSTRALRLGEQECVLSALRQERDDLARQHQQGITDLKQELREVRQAASLSMKLQLLREADLKDLQQRYQESKDVQDHQHQLLAKLSTRLSAASSYFHRLAGTEMSALPADKAGQSRPQQFMRSDDRPNG